MEYRLNFSIFLFLLTLQQTASKAINTDAFRSKPHFTSDNENSQDQRANDVISSLFHPEGNTRSTKLSDEREISRVEMTDDDREALLEIFRRVVLNLCLDREFDNPELCHKRNMEKKGWGNPDSIPWMARRIDHKFPF